MKIWKALPLLVASAVIIVLGLIGAATVVGLYSLSNKPETIHVGTDNYTVITPEAAKKALHFSPPDAGWGACCDLPGNDLVTPLRKRKSTKDKVSCFGTDIAVLGDDGKLFCALDPNIAPESDDCNINDLGKYGRFSSACQHVAVQI